ncbi:hypothetical protein D3Z50_04345, partial [Clostridiaceae bacterium]|nr:hypothetical protein [Clostridiaceae bacterium]
KVENIHSGWLSSGKLVAPKEDNIHQPGAAGEISLILAKSRGIVYNERRKSTHSKSGCSRIDYLPLSERRLLRLPTG